MLAGITARRLRAVVCGDDGPLAEWLQSDDDGSLARPREAAALAMAQLAALGARCVALGDPEYPAGLLDLRDPPPLLFVCGTLVSGGTAVIGTRTPSPDGLRMAQHLAAASDAPIVAGLALGIDAAAHSAAVQRGAATIAYVGNGLGATYPPQHRDLEAAIVARGGAVISERLPYADVAPWALVRRDRLQAAHASACILVESELGGGALHTMRFAAALGRPRFALEPRPGDSRTRGNARALAEGALPLGWDA